MTMTPCSSKHKDKFMQRAASRQPGSPSCCFFLRLCPKKQSPLLGESGNWRARQLTLTLPFVCLCNSAGCKGRPVKSRKGTLSSIHSGAAPRPNPAPAQPKTNHKSYRLYVPFQMIPQISVIWAFWIGLAHVPVLLYVCNLRPRPRPRPLQSPAWMTCASCARGRLGSDQRVQEFAYDGRR